MPISSSVNNAAREIRSQLWKLVAAREHARTDSSCLTPADQACFIDSLSIC
jgi:hypothetical protein